MHPRPFLRTASKCQLNASCGYGSPHPPVVEVKGAPQHVVIGFNLGSEKSSRRTDPCESPRSVLEPGALCVSEQSRSPRSPRSVLGSLLSGHESHSVRTEGVGLGVVPAAIKAEEVRVSKFSSQDTGKSNPIAISEQSEGICARRQSVAKGSFAMHESDFYSGIMMDGDYDDLDVDEDHATGHNESIFCAASPFSTCCSLELPGCDFLSACFFCKCCLTHGKDVYMYKGDKAFCSMECRYQQIVLDEFRERQSAAASCFMGASTRSSNMLGGVYAAVA